MAGTISASPSRRRAGKPHLTLHQDSPPHYALTGIAATGGSQFPDVSLAFLVDCGRRPAMAVEALRAGFALVRLDQDCPGHGAVCDIAAQCGARLLAARPPALDLGQTADPERALAGLRSP